jgi:hypothetical protein
LFLNPETGKEIEYQDLMKVPKIKPLWERGMGNTCGRLFQGLRHKMHQHLFFYLAQEHPQGSQNHVQQDFLFSSQKKEQERIRLTV